MSLGRRAILLIRVIIIFGFYYDFKTLEKLTVMFSVQATVGELLGTWIFLKRG
jgi:hypothetical protein